MIFQSQPTYTHHMWITFLQLKIFNSTRFYLLYTYTLCAQEVHSVHACGKHGGHTVDSLCGKLIHIFHSGKPQGFAHVLHT